MSDVGMARHEARNCLGYVRAYMGLSQEWAALIPAWAEDKREIEDAYGDVRLAIDALDRAVLNARLEG